MSFRTPKRRVSATLQLDLSSKGQTNRRLSTLSLEPLEDMVTCPIDLNLLEDPRLLPCGHAFCCDCLTRYMDQLPDPPPMGTGNATTDATFACPICRATFLIPLSKKGDYFPKAFNHKAILDFLRKTRLGEFKQSALSNPDSDGVGAIRKTSTQVSSQMLNYIVNDLTSRERDGRISATDKAVILDNINKLVSGLQSGGMKGMNQSRKKPLGSTTPIGNSPSGSERNLGRFQGFAARIRSPRNSTSGSDAHPSYTICRDLECVRMHMKRNAVYQVLAKGRDCCIMRIGEEFQPVDMQMLAIPRSASAYRCTLTANVERTDLIMWRQRITMDSENFMLDSRRTNKTNEVIAQSQGPIKMQEGERLKVQYVRFYGNRIFLTGIVSPIDQSEQANYGNQGETQQNEYGILVCCTATDLNDLEDSICKPEGKIINKQSQEPFPVQCVSCVIRRDPVGCERLNHPIVFGIDIDHATGDIYVTEPANAMICRFRDQNLTQTDGTWYLNEPQLSPYFVCYDSENKQIWATCPKEDKVVILDTETDGFNHFTPSLSFGITPSHIIYTSDNRIVVLDGNQSRLFWITKTHQTICVQCLELRFHKKQKRQYLAIQPVDDAVTSVVSKSSGFGENLVGGILCAHDYGCSLIYPKRQLKKIKMAKASCFSFRSAFRKS
ncbi:unnamed protein product [Calicophoron daubneyi]|uniref:RING-type domain-containing protein n=1 Tax=Calicophoron daubneyi TaxID=300641 RepID=A0AAV2TYW9_CALDB